MKPTIAPDRCSFVDRGYQLWLFSYCVIPAWTGVFYGIALAYNKVSFFHVATASETAANNVAKVVHELAEEEPTPPGSNDELMVLQHGFVTN